MSQHDAEMAAIATSSVEDGLDFACSLISPALSELGHAKPDQAPRLLNDITQYIRLRYVGEPLLAMEYLAGIGNDCSDDRFPSAQFWRQLDWVAKQMKLTDEDTLRLGLKLD